MGKRLKLKLLRVIPSFQTCRSKEDPSTLASNPIPSFLRLSSISDPHHPAVNHPNTNTVKRHVSSALTSMGCGSSSRSPPDDHHGGHNDDDDDFHWEKEDKYWHVIAKLYPRGGDRGNPDSAPRRNKVDSSPDDGAVVVPYTCFSPPPLAPPNTDEEVADRKQKRRRRRHNKKIRPSADRERETLVGASSGSSSSDYRPKRVNRRRRKSSSKRCVWGEIMTPPRLSRWMAVEGKVRESFAVVKRSEEPYEDFKRSMMEMVVEKRMFQEDDLEELLHCFLSLNSSDHHGVIVRAFAEVWGALFGLIQLL